MHATFSLTKPAHRPASQLRSLVAGVCFILFATLAAQADIQFDVLFGPETPTGRYKHPSSFTELSNGDLYAVFFSGDGEYEDPSAAVYGSRLKRGARRWSRPAKVAGNPFYALGNPVVWEAPNGWVWLFYVTRHGDLWDTSRITAKISKDHAQTWSESFQVTHEAGTMTRSRPIVTSEGHYLLPAYHEVGEDTESVGPDCTSFFLIFDPVRLKWTESNRIRSRLGGIQPAVARVSDTHLVAFCRRGGDYEGRPDGWMVRTESHDDGRTWSPGIDTDLPNPNAAVEFIRLQSGHHLLIYNHSFSERTPLTLALSTDGARTFPHRRNLVADPDQSYAYPTAIQLKNGEIQVLFTADERTALKRARFREQDVFPEIKPTQQPSADR